MSKVLSYDLLFDEETKNKIKNDYIKNGLSIRKISEKYNIKSKSWIEKLLNGVTRTLSDANRNAHILYPDRFKHTEKVKKIMREKRLKFMKENPEKTAWRLKNKSYPEACFEKILNDTGLSEKYLIYREYSVYPYFIDFAFVDIKLAVEIDGSQHLEKNRALNDKKKDALLLNNGWKILRITANDVMSNKDTVIKELEGFLDNSADNFKKVGILKAPKTRKKAIRGEDGLTEKQRIAILNNRKVKNRPSKEDLFDMVKKVPFTHIAKKYNVSDKAVSKWCKQYGLPYRKSDIEN